MTGNLYKLTKTLILTWMQLSLTSDHQKRRLHIIDKVHGREFEMSIGYSQGLVKGAKLFLNPYFFGWLEKRTSLITIMSSSNMI